MTTIRLEAPWPPAPAGEKWEEAFVYLDEQHPNPDPGNDTFAVGVLMTPTRVARSVVVNALAKLRPESKAVRAGYIHAKDHGRDARVALADAFGAWVDAAEFRAMRWRPADQGPRSKEQDNDLHMHVASMAIGRAYDIAERRVVLEYAASPKTLEFQRFIRWLLEHERVRVDSMARHQGKIPTRFPAVVLNESTPLASPGIQAVDLMLWEQRRVRRPSKARPPEGHFVRMKLTPEMSWVQEDGPMELYMIARNAPPPHAVRPTPALDGLGWPEWAGILFGMERLVHKLARDVAPPEHVGPLMPAVVAASAAFRNNPRLTIETQTDFLRAFLMVADTLPIYRTDEEKQVAANAIGIACSMLDLRLISAISNLDRWQDLRQANVEHLGWEAAQLEPPR